jgi:hypothetical protein
LNSTLPNVHPVEKEVSHGQQAEEKEEDEEVTTPRGLRIEAAPLTSESRGALSGVS